MDYPLRSLLVDSNRIALMNHQELESYISDIVHNITSLLRVPDFESVEHLLMKLFHNNHDQFKEDLITQMLILKMYSLLQNFEVKEALKWYLGTIKDRLRQRLDENAFYSANQKFSDILSNDEGIFYKSQFISESFKKELNEFVSMLINGLRHSFAKLIEKVREEQESAQNIFRMEESEMNEDGNLNLRLERRRSDFSADDSEDEIRDECNSNLDQNEQQVDLSRLSTVDSGNFNFRRSCYRTLNASDLSLNLNSNVRDNSNNANVRTRNHNRREEISSNHLTTRTDDITVNRDSDIFFRQHVTQETNDKYYNSNSKYFENMNNQIQNNTSFLNQIKEVKNHENRFNTCETQTVDNHSTIYSASQKSESGMQSSLGSFLKPKTNKFKSEEFNYLMPIPKRKDFQKDMSSNYNIYKKDFIPKTKAKKKDNSNPLSKIYNPKLVKKENIDKKVIRRFRNYITESYKKLITFIEKDAQFWTVFLKENLLPPVKYFNPISAEKVEFKSFSCNFLTWLFTKPGAKEIYRTFIRENINEIMHDLAGSYNPIDQSAELFSQVETYVKNLATTYGSSNTEESKIFSSNEFLYGESKLNNPNKDLDLGAPVVAKSPAAGGSTEIDSFLLKSNSKQEYNSIWENQFLEMFGDDSERNDQINEMSDHSLNMSRERSRNYERNRNYYNNTEDLDLDQNGIVLDRVFNGRDYDDFQDSDE